MSSDDQHPEPSARSPVPHGHAVARQREEDDEPFLVQGGSAHASRPPTIASLGPLSPVRGLEEKLPFEFADATALLEAMRAGRQTPAALLEEHLARLTRQHNRLNAACQMMTENALAQAARPVAGPLGGLPISVKEQIGLGGEQITTGSRRMTPVDCPRDAAVVTRLLEAGAIVLARGNVPELGLANETDNPRFGRTNNPLDPTRTCGGSSGGDAALVASGCVAAAVGSELVGSLRLPAAFCGVVSYKPFASAVDKRGVWPPLTGMLDGWHCVGPITRSVRDARLMAEVMSGPLSLPPLLEELEYVIPAQLPFRIQDPAIESAWRRAERSLELAGLRRVTLDFADIAPLARDIGAVLASELLPVLDDALRGTKGERFSRLQETWRRVRGQGSVSDALLKVLATLPVLKPRGPDRVQALFKRFLQARDRYHRLLGPNRLLLMPTLGMLAPPHGAMNRATLRPGWNDALTPLPLPNYLDLASLTLPAWSDRDPTTGLPPSITLAGVHGSEPALFAAAQALEKVLAVPGQADVLGNEPRITWRLP